LSISPQADLVCKDGGEQGRIALLQDELEDRIHAVIAQSYPFRVSRTARGARRYEKVHVLYQCRLKVSPSLATTSRALILELVARMRAMPTEGLEKGTGSIESG
jgi:hypothetical protein